MSRRQVHALVLLLLLAAPGALAHGEEVHVEPGRDAETGETTAPNAGYTGPGREPYVSFIEGVWLYGQAAVTPLADNQPRHVRGWGDWLVWEDAGRGDIYVYAISAGTGYYLTLDRAVQRNPEIWDGVVVYEDYSGTRADVRAHFLETGETRILSTGPGNHRRPSIHGDLVAWEDDRNGTADVWGARLHEGSEFPLYQSPDKESDPLVLGDAVYFRTYRFNVWDVMSVDVQTGESRAVTSTPAIESAPVTNGRDVFYFAQAQQGTWRLVRYDAARERAYDTVVKAADTTPVPLSGDYAIQQARDVGKVQLVARNLTSGATTHVSGNLALATDPLLLGGTVYAMVKTANGTSLLALDVSPFAFGTPPSLGITNPTRAIMPWTRPVVVQGVLRAGPGWTEPVTFTYRVDGGAPQAIPPGQTWRVTLDNDNVPEGNHRVVFRATFREGPPVETALTLVVPVKNANVDVAQLGPQYHAAKTMAAFNTYIASNPASWLLLPLALVLLVLLLVRLWILLRPRRAVVEAEYVHPDEP
jgi:beta propeller repeat protein